MSLPCVDGFKNTDSMLACGLCFPLSPEQRLESHSVGQPCTSHPPQICFSLWLQKGIFGASLEVSGVRP